MSADEIRTEQRSSVKITENSKGEPAVEIKAYTHDLEALDAAREKAVATYKQARIEARAAAGLTS